MITIPLVGDEQSVSVAGSSGVLEPSIADEVYPSRFDATEVAEAEILATVYAFVLDSCGSRGHEGSAEDHEDGAA